MYQLTYFLMPFKIIYIVDKIILVTINKHVVYYLYYEFILLNKVTIMTFGACLNCMPTR